MNRDQFEARFGADDETDLLGLLRRVGQQRSTARALVDAIWRELPEDEADAELEQMDLAAADQAQAAFPARYVVGDWRLALGLDIDGTPIAVLERGPAVRLLLGGREIALTPGVVQRVPGLLSPPERVVWIDADGRTWEVKRE